MDPHQIAYAKEHLDYCPTTGEFKWKKSGSGRIAGKVVGFVDNGYRKIRMQGKALRAHRVAMAMSGINPAGLEVDHINGDKLDNRLCNLRLATRQENKCNSYVADNSSIGTPGVFKHRDKFQARVTLGRVRHHLGTYDTVEAAKAAYTEAALRLHGKFAKVE